MARELVLGCGVVWRWYDTRLVYGLLRRVGERDMTVVERWTIFVCTGCGQATGRHKDCDAKREAVSVVLADEYDRLHAFAFGDAPEWVKANATLKHRVRELEAELAEMRRTHA